MANHANKQSGMVLIAVLLSIALLSMIILAGLTETLLNERSVVAYTTAIQARVSCERWVHQPIPILISQRLLKTVSCAMVSERGATMKHPVSFWARDYRMLRSLSGVCESITVMVDDSRICQDSTLIVQPGIQTWRWYSDTVR